VPTKKIIYPLFEEPYLPTVVAKIEKEKGKFTYSVSLTAIIKGRSREIVRIDNYHGIHHRHELWRGNESRSEAVFSGLGSVVEAIINGWKQYVRLYEKAIEEGVLEDEENEKA